MFPALLLLLTTVPHQSDCSPEKYTKALPRLLNSDHSKTVFKTNHFMARISPVSSVRLLAPDYHIKLTSSLLSIAISELFKACNESPVLYVNKSEAFWGEATFYSLYLTLVLYTQAIIKPKSQYISQGPPNLGCGRNSFLTLITLMRTPKILPSAILILRALLTTPSCSPDPRNCKILNARLRGPFDLVSRATHAYIQLGVPLHSTSLVLAAAHTPQSAPLAG